MALKCFPNDTRAALKSDTATTESGLICDKVFAANLELVGRHAAFLAHTPIANIDDAVSAEALPVVVEDRNKGPIRHSNGITAIPLSPRREDRPERLAGMPAAFRIV